jgi:3alpha(or 20beta)-hydroxysteroid dehydrogenase
MQRLENKIAIITGAARGSGAATARRFIAEGAHVIVADVRDEMATELVQELGPGSTFVHCDVTDEADWQSLVDAVMGVHGRIDVLVNNAAVLLLAPLAQTSTEEYLRVFRVNELGPFLGTRTVAGPMAAGGGGSIINISSIDGVYVAPFTGAYAASKFAVRGLAKVAALELGAAGIRVNCICPAAGNPEMILETLPPALRELADGDGLSSRVPVPPVGRHGQMDDVAWAAVFLASDESGYITGTELVLDGGITAGMNMMATMARDG